MSNQPRTTLTNVKDTDLKNDELEVKMQLTQTVNRKAAHWLIMNWDTLDVSHGSYDPVTGKREYDPEIQRNMFIKYFKQLSRDGTVMVDYKQNLVNGKPRARMLNKLPVDTPCKASRAGCARRYARTTSWMSICRMHILAF